MIPTTGPRARTIQASRQPSAPVGSSRPTPRIVTDVRVKPTAVWTDSAEPAVSLHVYAPALDTMRHYVLDDQGRPQVVSLERNGTDW